MSCHVFPIITCRFLNYTSQKAVISVHRYKLILQTAELREQEWRTKQAIIRGFSLKPDKRGDTVGWAQGERLVSYHFHLDVSHWRIQASVHCRQAGLYSHPSFVQTGDFLTVHNVSSITFSCF